jgi:polysaccharide pyruvyl transferase WcaK-like protein
MLQRKKRNFILFGTYGEDNTGDDILLLAMIKGLRLRWRDCRLIILTGNRLRTKTFLEREKIPLDRVILLYSGRWGILEPSLRIPHSLGWILENIRWAGRCDLLIIGPGNQLQDVTNRWRLIFFLSRSLMTWVLGRRYAFIGLGFWEVRHGFSRILLRLVGRRAAIISTRDQGSARQLVQMGIGPEKITALADISFLLAEDE